MGNSLLPFVFLSPWHAEVPGPGIEPEPQQCSKLQCLNLLCLPLFLLFFFFFFFPFFVFLRPHQGHMEIPRLGIKSELQLPTYATATARQDPSLVCNLHHSSRQRWTLNPLNEARDRTHILMDSSPPPIPF